MLSLSKIKICDIFVFIWGMYYLQDILYPQGLINQVLQLIMIGLGLVPLFQCLFCRLNPALIRATLLLILMYVVYGSIIIMFGDNVSWTSDSSYLQTSFNSLLPILFFYQQTRRSNLTLDRIKVYFFFIGAITIIHFMNVDKIAMLLDSKENTNNVGYMILSLLPFVFLFSKKPLLQYIIFATLLFYILTGMKRGAILIGTIVAVLFVYSSIRGQGFAKKFFVILFAAIVIALLMNYVGQMISTNEYFARRIQSTIEGESSGRGEIYSSVWSAIKNEPNLFKILFGHGANSSIHYAGNFAHNDWLETLCNNGILGFSLLLYFFISFLRTVFYSKSRLTKNLYYCFISLFIISFLKTIFSMSIQNFDMYQGMLIGFLSYHTLSRDSKESVNYNIG